MLEEAVGDGQRETAEGADAEAEERLADQEREGDGGDRRQRDGQLCRRLGHAADRQRGQRDQPRVQRGLLAEELRAHADVEGRLSLEHAARVQHEAGLVGRRDDPLAQRGQDEERRRGCDQQRAADSPGHARQQAPGR